VVSWDHESDGVSHPWPGLPLERLLHVEFSSPDHLHWPDLDIDLSVGSLEHPEKFPLVSKKRPNSLQRSAGGRAVEVRETARARRR
jgi:hypothetical protein